MYDEYFNNDVTYNFGKITDKEEVKTILKTYIEKYYDAADDKDTWFYKIKDLTEELGYESL